MKGEADVSQEKEWHSRKLAERCLAALEKHHMKAYYAATGAEACQKALELIPPGAVIGVGDSVTLFQIGLVNELEKRGGHQIFNPFKVGENGLFMVGAPERLELMKKALTSDVFVVGSNAVTLDGKLVNIDAQGNRVAGLLFGPRKVIVVVGVNKIVKDVAEALQRIKEVAAPSNARRHYLKHGMTELPCTATGTCSDCRHPQRICCYTVIVDYQRVPATGREPRLNVILVGESLGL